MQPGKNTSGDKDNEKPLEIDKKSQINRSASSRSFSVFLTIFTLYSAIRNIFWKFPNKDGQFEESEWKLLYVC